MLVGSTFSKAEVISVRGGIAELDIGASHPDGDCFVFFLLSFFFFFFFFFFSGL